MLAVWNQPETRRLRTHGLFQEELANMMVPVTKLLDLQSFLYHDSKEEIEEKTKQAKQILSGYGSMCKILKSGGNDMSSALQTVKTAANLKAAEEKRVAKAKKRATKLPAECATSDPSAIKSYRVIEKQQGFPMASSFEQLKIDMSGGQAPFILRLDKNNSCDRFSMIFYYSGPWPMAHMAVVAVASSFF